MKKLKNLFISTALIALFSNFNSYSHYNLTNNSIIKDNLIVLKSEMKEVIINFPNKKNHSKFDKITNYHVINLDTSEIIFFYNKNGNEWERQSSEYFSIRHSPEIIEFDTSNETFQKVKLFINPYSKIEYLFKNNTIKEFSKLEKIDVNEIVNLGIYNWKNSFKPKDKSKTITINERIEDYEYLDYWRKESFKKAIAYIKKILGNQNTKCKMVRRSSYNPSNLNYLGYQGYRIKLYAEYDCNKNYINESFFWIDVYYLGYNKWSLDLIDQKLTH